MKKKKARQASKKPTVRQHSAQGGAAQSKPAAASEPTPKAAAALGQPEIQKIQGLLTSKTSDGVTLGLSLLESLGATGVDYETVFTKTLIQSILGSWVAEAWGAVAKAIVPYGAVSELFQKLAEEKFLKRPRRLLDFNGLLHARVATARAASLTKRDGSVNHEKRFIDLVEIPAGSFMMGSPGSEDGHDECEDQVAVRISKPFAMGRTVVTQAQWREVTGTEPWRYEDLEENQCRGDFPAVYVSWEDAVLFCQSLTDLERETGRLTATQSYRLPTIAEWEYACRAGTTTAYSFGDDPKKLGDYGWYEKNSGNKIHAVAKKQPNPWGLFDMHGNVAEWCADWYADKIAGGDDPVGPTVGSYRVFRGGNWQCVAGACRSAFGAEAEPWYRRVGNGFRVVREG